VTAVEKFAQLIPLNIQEIFTWYFEQKGVDNPERFLAQGVNNGVNEGVNNQPESLLPAGSEGDGASMNQPETEQQNNVQSSAPLLEQPEENSKLQDVNALLGLISLLSKLKSKNESKAGDDFMSILSQILEEVEEK
jgi:hypothetical protein